MPSPPHLTFIESGFSSHLIDYVSVPTAARCTAKPSPALSADIPHYSFCWIVSDYGEAEEGENNPGLEVYIHLLTGKRSL